MKILTINTRYIGGGGAAYIANMLHREINKIEEFSSTFLYGRGIKGDDNSYRIIYPKMDYLSALSYRFISKEINFNKDIEKQIKECDIVHLHNIHGYYLNYSKLFYLLKKHNKKIIWTLHDMWSITGRCAYTYNCEKWKIKCGNCPSLKTYPKSIRDISEKELYKKKKIIESIDKENLIIVTPSKWLAEICKESYLSKYKIINIPNGIEYVKPIKSKEEIRNKYNIPLDKRVILFVAADTCDERKGIRYIVDTIDNCKEYIFISLGKELNDIKFENFIQLGYKSDRNEINEIYSMSDLFVIPSVDENFPTTVIESFANSTPVVGFNVGGIPEQIESTNGKIIEDITSQSLEKGIRLLLEDSNKLKQLSRNANDKFNNEYRLDRFIQSYLNLYKELGYSKNI